MRLWDWEVNQSGWKCTSEVLLESERACRQLYGPAARVMLVCGIDMLKKMADPGFNILQLLAILDFYKVKLMNYKFASLSNYSDIFDLSGYREKRQYNQYVPCTF